MTGNHEIAVSVLMITYNHEAFIEQAVESAVAQETNFEFEVVIGEDCSTDSTRSVLCDLRERDPRRLRLLLNDRNIGAHNNFVQTLRACRGRYIALLEGDDYWTDAKKLQKQADFLESHPDFAICFHNARVSHEDGSSEPDTYCSSAQPSVAGLEDLLMADFIPNCSVMFRSGLIAEFPDWFYELKTGDWSLHLLNAQHGKIGYLDETMACYRIHPGGMWSTQSMTRKIHEILKIYDRIDSHLGYRYSRIIRVARSSWYHGLALAYDEAGDMRNARRYALKSFVHRPFNPRISTARQLKTLFQLWTPGIYARLKTSAQALRHSRSRGGKSRVGRRNPDDSVGSKIDS